MAHIPILLRPCIDALSVDANGCYVDGTFGRGGHTQEILNRLGSEGQLIAIDQDPAAIAYGQERFSEDDRFELVHDSFENIKQVLQGRQVDGIFLDLGVSSPQLDEGERGFSFMRDGPLDMRMDTTRGQPLSQWFESVGEETLVWVLKNYGEERFARRIARAVLGSLPITTTQELSNIVTNAIPVKEKHKHPATRSFQAFRIALNRELEVLKNFLNDALDCLKVGGRLVILSFHSLEDRLVKQSMQKWVKGDSFPSDLPIKHVDLNQRVKWHVKMQKPDEAEINENPRARSAVLRACEKIA